MNQNAFIFVVMEKFQKLKFVMMELIMTKVAQEIVKVFEKGLIVKVETLLQRRFARKFVGMV